MDWEIIANKEAVHTWTKLNDNEEVFDRNMLREYSISLNEFKTPDQMKWL